MPLSEVASPAVASSRELAKLQKAAGEFESMLLESLWKSMKETFADSEDPNSDPTLENFDDWGVHAMAGAVGSNGGLGIKKLILQYLEPKVAGGRSGPTPVP
jgi:Rod binding domain-containing protein